MNIQNNIDIDDLLIEAYNSSRYEITLTKNFLIFIPNPDTRSFVIDEIFEYILNYHLTSIDEAYLNRSDEITPFYSGKAELNSEVFTFHLFWNEEENFQFLLLDKPAEKDNFKFFNINYHENILNSEILH